MDPVLIGVASTITATLCGVIAKLYTDLKSEREGRMADLRQYTAALLDVQERLREKLQENTAEERDRLLAKVDDLLEQADPPRVSTKPNHQRRLRQ